METLFTSFKKQFPEVFASLLWKQWEKLGIAVWTHEEISWMWLIDPESLIFATSQFREEDPRLFNVMQEWIRFYQQYLHPARLRRILRHYKALSGQIKVAAPIQERPVEIRLPRQSQRAREIVGHTDWGDPSLLWLKLRAFLGAGPRSDILTYFLYHENGTTYEISRKMFIDQKSVHEVLRMWEPSGWVTRIGKRRGYTFSIRFRERLKSLMDVGEVPPAFDAGRVYTGLLLVWRAVQRFAEHRDAYLLSSHLRDLYPMVIEVWDLTGSRFPNPTSYPGKAFAPVFLNALLEVCNRLGSPPGRPREHADGETGKEEGILRFREQDMYEPAYRALRRRYPAHKGWIILPQFTEGETRPDFVIERREAQGTLHRVIVDVKATCEITRMHIDQLNRYARNLDGPDVQIEGKLLIVPSGAKITWDKSEDVDIVFLRSFRCGE